MLDFTLTQDDFAKATRQLTVAREGAPGELLDLTCYTGNVKFVVTGREFTCPAEVTGKGGAKIPLALLAKLRKVAATFGNGPLRLRIEKGRIKINSMSLSHDDISLGPITDRPIDIPDDAGELDILALRLLFTPEEVAASNLTGRYRAAFSKKIKKIDSAALGLAEYGISPEAIERLVHLATEARAQILRPMLKPTVGNERIH